MIMVFLSSLLNYVLSLSSDASLRLFRKWFYLNLPLVGSGPVKARHSRPYLYYMPDNPSLISRRSCSNVGSTIFGVRTSYTQSYQLRLPSHSYLHPRLDKPMGQFPHLDLGLRAIGDWI